VQCLFVELSRSYLNCILIPAFILGCLLVAKVRSIVGLKPIQPSLALKLGLVTIWPCLLLFLAWLVVMILVSTFVAVFLAKVSPEMSVPMIRWVVSPIFLIAAAIAICWMHLQVALAFVSLDTKMLIRRTNLAAKNHWRKFADVVIFLAIWFIAESSLEQSGLLHASVLQDLVNAVVVLMVLPYVFQKRLLTIDLGTASGDRHR
jgi:hypothetical protein